MGEGRECARGNCVTKESGKNPAGGIWTGCFDNSGCPDAMDCVVEDGTCWRRSEVAVAKSRYHEFLVVGGVLTAGAVVTTVVVAYYKKVTASHVASNPWTNPCFLSKF